MPWCCRWMSEPVNAIRPRERANAQIRALDRTQPGLPLKKGRGPTSCWKHASSVMTHDYKRGRHDDALCRAQCTDWRGHEPEHAAPQASGIHPLPEPDRARRADRKGHSRDPRQRLHPQTFEGSRLAGTTPPLDVPLHPDIKLLAERGGRGLCQIDPATAQTRRSGPPSNRWRAGPSLRSVGDLQDAISRFIAEHNHTEGRPSSGAPIPTTSSPPETEGSKCWIQSTMCAGHVKRGRAPVARIKARSSDQFRG